MVLENEFLVHFIWRKILYCCKYGYKISFKINSQNCSLPFLLRNLMIFSMFYELRFIV